VQRARREDSRGFLQRLFCKRDLESVLSMREVKQVNHTNTKYAGTVRGLHFQLPPHAETKLVSCVRGEVWDVAVDLRADSPTFLRYHRELLSDSNQISLLLPEGVAHGFQTMCDDCELVYLHTETYEPDYESGINVFDDTLNIPWPLPITELSERDQRATFITDSFKGVTVT
jgi:dTDP-4-dehydrorhamnose 3,5-epimerase